MRTYGGFTLIETMVTVAIAAILMTIAVPSFLTFIQNARFNSQTSDLTTALMYARSEAVARNLPVTVCSVSSGFDISNCPTPSNPTKVAVASCACSGSTSWGSGYVVFVDRNNNGVIEGDGTLANAEPVLRAYSQLAGNNTLNSGNPRATFMSNGYSPTFGGNMRLCDSRGTTKSRRIVLTDQGRSTYCSCDASSVSPPVCPASAGCATACP